MTEGANPEHKDTYVAERRRGDEAERLMSDELLVAAFAAIHEQLNSAIWEGDLDPTRLADCVRAGKLLRMIESNIKEHIETGKLAKASLDLLED